MLSYFTVFNPATVCSGLVAITVRRLPKGGRGPKIIKALQRLKGENENSLGPPSDYMNEFMCAPFRNTAYQQFKRFKKPS